MSLKLFRGLTLFGCLVLYSCALLVSYVEPTGPQTAELHIKNNAPERLGLQIYEGAADCSKKRRVIWMDAGADLNVRVKAPEATAYSLNTEHLAGGAVNGDHTIAVRQEFCLSMFSFEPQVGGRYDITYQALSGGCGVEAVESLGHDPHLFNLTQRTFVRPFSEDGAFCERLGGA